MIYAIVDDPCEIGGEKRRCLQGEIERDKHTADGKTVKMNEFNVDINIANMINTMRFAVLKLIILCIFIIFDQ